MEQVHSANQTDGGQNENRGHSHPSHAWCIRSSQRDQVWHSPGFAQLARRCQSACSQDPVGRLLEHEALLGLHQQALTDGTECSCRLVFRRDSGLAALEAKVSPGSAPGDPDAFTVTTLREIDRELEIEAVLHAERRLRQTLFENIPDAALMVNERGMIVFANTTALRLFGHSRLEGMAVQDLIPASQRPRHEQLMSDYLTQPEARHKGLGRPLRALHADGHSFPVEIALCPFRRGDVVEVITMIRDVRERLALEREVRQVQRLEATSTLAAGLAHDFNNLLGVMLGEMERIEMQDSLPEIWRSSARASRAGATAASICERLLTLSGSSDDGARSIDLGQLVRSWVDVMVDAFAPDVTFEVEIAAGIGSMMMDPWGLENALLNLCRNAREAMPDGGRIRVEVRPVDGPDELFGAGESDWLEIIVRDQGIGIPRDSLERIFDALYTTKRRGAGHGLGLAMVQAFARQAGGRLDVASTGCEGTAMRLLLPVRAP